MNLLSRVNRSVVIVALLSAAGLAGACATSPADGVAAGSNAGAGFDRAMYEGVDLQWRQAAVATAFLSRVEEVEAADQNPQDPEHYRGYAEAARHMLARADERLSSYGVTHFEGSTSEADAVLRADIRRVASEYAAQAVSLQREVVRLDRRAGLDVGSDGNAGPAVTDLGLLLSLRSVMVSVPSNTGVASGGASGGAGAGVPKVASGGAAAPSAEGADDEASKRRGFATHPGYTPTPK